MFQRRQVARDAAFAKLAAHVLEVYDIILLETRISESQPSRQKHTLTVYVFVNTGLRRIST